MIHDQGSTHMCWAYSTTTSIRNTWKRTLKQMDEAKNNGTWNPIDIYSNRQISFNYQSALT